MHSSTSFVYLRPFHRQRLRIPLHQRFRCPGLSLGSRFRADSDFDLRHYVAFSGVWELPFAKMWDSGPKRLTHGWTLYPIVTYRSGIPMTVFAGLSHHSYPHGAVRSRRWRLDARQPGWVVHTFDPQAIRRLPIRIAVTSTAATTTSIPSVFSNAQFMQTFRSGGQPADRTYGTSGRNEYRGPDRINFDLSLAKTISLYRSA